MLNHNYLVDNNFKQFDYMSQQYLDVMIQNTKYLDAMQQMNNV